MVVTCPCCFARFGIEAALEDEAARELMVLLADLPREIARPLVSYLSLFRSASRALAWDRALRLARETLALGDHGALGAALSETVDAMRTKQGEGNWRPLGNHNYLKRVLESCLARGIAVTSAMRDAPQPTSKTGQALAALERRKRDRD